VNVTNDGIQNELIGITQLYSWG